MRLNIRFAVERMQGPALVRLIWDTPNHQTTYVCALYNDSQPKFTNAFTGLPSFLNSEVLHAHGGQLKMNNDKLLGLPWLG